MKNHVLRPLFAAMALVALILTARALMVPSDFGVHGKSFTYNFYRAGAVSDWKNFPVSYKGSNYCVECHNENAESIAASKHRIIQCENCHGPARAHAESGGTTPTAHHDWPKARICAQCHVHEHSPEFDLDRYWPRIAHGKETP